MSSAPVLPTASPGADVPLLFAYPAIMLSFARWLMPEIRKNPPAIIRPMRNAMLIMFCM
jgi:hypothetical protein